MKHKLIIIWIIAFCMSSKKSLSQNFDSTHIYALSMGSLYRVTIDKDLIKNEVDPIVLKEANQQRMLYSLLMDTIKAGKSKKIKSNHLDIRLYFEFFKNGQMVQAIGFTPQNTMFVNYSLYLYDKQQLKHLNNYVMGLANILGIK